MDTHTVPVYREGEISPFFTASHASVEGRAGSSPMRIWACAMVGRCTVSKAMTNVLDRFLIFRRLCDSGQR